MKSLIIMTLLFLTNTIFAQNPVHWTYTAKKTGDKVYEIHLIAVIESPWHIYSQTQPRDAINIPVSIKFNANPLVNPIEGLAKEVGKMQKVKDKSTGIEANEYTTKVDFIQVIKLKASAQTNLIGTINYQICNEEMCLPPKSEKFNILIK